MLPGQDVCTLLSAFPDKSPQLQHPEKTRLNLFTTQNINMKDPDTGREYNKVISNKGTREERYKLYAIISNRLNELIVNL